ncbi:hypothetical protein CLU79DRAFT_394260 [Phycomyces nitens]|nr:hypothetical protein CLU79DRAFT_394260 [Phycomyces nitens]
MSDINAISKNFIDYYYMFFDSDRQALASIYRDNSMLTFEGEQFAGKAAIIGKLTSLAFKQVRHNISTCDAQPGSPTRPSIIVTVTGQLYIDEERNPQLFSQTFHLIPESGSYYVFNDIFRLILG